MAHRKAANDLFKSKKGKELLKEIAKKTKTGQTGTVLESNGTNGRYFCAMLSVSVDVSLIWFLRTESGASPAEVAKIREAIKTANSLQEVERLTRILQAGGPITDEMLNGNGVNNGEFWGRLFFELCWRSYEHFSESPFSEMHVPFAKCGFASRFF